MKTAQEHQRRSCLFLIAQEIRQTSQQLCEAAAVGLETAQDLVQRSLLAQQAREAARAKRVSRGRSSPP